MKILMVLTSHDQLGDTGNKTGFWLEEFATPFYTFKDAGGEYAKADDWANFVQVDGRLITGQNPTSSAATAKALLDQLG